MMSGESFFRNMPQYSSVCYFRNVNRDNMLVLLFFSFYFRPYRENTALYSEVLDFSEPPIETNVQ